MAEPGRKKKEGLEEGGWIWREKTWKGLELVSKNFHVRVAKRDCKHTLFYMDKQIKTVKRVDLVILYTKSCHALMSF